MIWLAIFLILSGVLLARAWPDLRTPTRHGFYRVFAFETLLGLVLLGAPVWFVDPLSARQIVSWILLAASLALAIHGITILHRFGAPQAGIEPTQYLVQVGIYRVIRHPLYMSLALLGVGAALKRPGACSGGLLLVLWALLLATALVEERENLARFGEAYREYMCRTWRFIPFLF